MEMRQLMQCRRREVGGRLMLMEGKLSLSHWQEPVVQEGVLSRLPPAFSPGLSGDPCVFVCVSGVVGVRAGSQRKVGNRWPRGAEWAGILGHELLSNCGKAQSAHHGLEGRCSAGGQH
jgi:hypothetical protein